MTFVSYKKRKISLSADKLSTFPNADLLEQKMLLQRSTYITWISLCSGLLFLMCSMFLGERFLFIVLRYLIELLVTVR
jgi:hypothetical protein